MFEKQESKLISLLTASFFPHSGKGINKSLEMFPLLRLHQLTVDGWKNLQVRTWWWWWWMGGGLGGKQLSKQ